ncbi:MAG TPA: hypothetical protein VHM90_17585 [Phycisphaerae bacterium]|nr:hypothetical protein [Phycisphaerae bacterium]
MIEEFSMSSAAQTLLSRFDSLNAEDQKEVAAEILRRSLVTEPMNDAQLSEAAASVFQAYDAEAKRGEN